MSTCARAVLICRPNSYPFQDRTVALDKPVKVGRSVGKARPTPTNAIFDCKVLSRNHALLSFENGKFLLQDTESSNGTFVNQNKISKSQDQAQSTPQEVWTGDIVQFGVPVVQPDSNVAHGCIIASLDLYLPSGEEAKNLNAPQNSSHIANYQEVHRLNQLCKESADREKALAFKLNLINKLIETMKDSVKNNWKSLIDEDRLLTRIETLERQLENCSSKNVNEEKLKAEIVQLIDEKEKCQSSIKMSIQKLIQEKNEMFQNKTNLERNLQIVEEEKTTLNQHFDRQKTEIATLTKKVSAAEQLSTDLMKKCEEATTKYESEIENLCKLIKMRDELILAKQALVSDLIRNLDKSTAKEILVAHHENLEIYSINNEPSVEVNSHTNGARNDTEEDVNMNVMWENSSEIESMKDKLKSSENIKKEANGLIEDLKKDSNKLDLEDVCKRIVDTVCSEMYKCKDSATSDSSIQNNAFETEKNVAVGENVENHINFRDAEEISKLKELLAESNDSLSKLTCGNLSLTEKTKQLTENLNRINMENELYAKKIEALSLTNSELNQQLSSSQDEVNKACNENNELKNLLHAAEKAIKDNDLSFRDSICALENKLQEKEKTLEILSQGSDLRRASTNNAVPSSSTETQTLSVIGAKDDWDGTQDDKYCSKLLNKLLETEEELGLFKSKYSELMNHFNHVNDRLRASVDRDGKSKGDAKLQLWLLIPVVILLLAIFIATRS